ncbi:MAG: glutathione S-transferase family protein [Rhodoblastus sp.]|nr:glutathione S-transferase family protein [Rhodoblastus sp.]MCB9999226.1 glutathione S-transferase family protein [Methylobacteriaceae bacterium]
MALTLVIGNKSYSSWSMRPWMLLDAFGIPFSEVVIPLYVEGSKEQILKYTPSGKVPTLIDGDVTVWDSLSICEYVAEKFPDRAIWPRDAKARALARSMSAEMHSSFQALRQQCGMVVHRTKGPVDFSPETLADIARIEAMWANAREQFGQGGPFLFGAFCAADAMYAPVVCRFDVYQPKLSAATRAYMDAVMATPAWTKWMAGAASETWRIPRFEPQPA